MVQVEVVEGIYATRYEVRVNANAVEIFTDPAAAYDRAVELAREQASA